MGGDDPLEPEARRLEQVLELLLGALPATQEDEHVEVHRLRGARPIVRGDEHLDEQQLARRSEGTVAVLQELRRPLVVPVVDEVMSPIIAAGGGTPC